MKTKLPNIDREQLSEDKPIEDELLEFVQYMAQKFEHIASYRDLNFFERLFVRHNETAECAKNYADAYRIMEKRIINEIYLRKRRDLRIRPKFKEFFGYTA